MTRKSAGLLTLGLMFVAASAQAQEGSPGNLMSMGRNVDVAGANPAPGTPVIMWDWNGGTNQQFYMYSNHIISFLGTCLQSGADNLITEQACNWNVVGQYWVTLGQRLIAADGGCVGQRVGQTRVSEYDCSDPGTHYNIYYDESKIALRVGTGLCVDGSNRNSQVVLTYCNDASSQQWYPGYGSFYNGRTNQCLQINGGIAYTYECNTDQPWQKFAFRGYLVNGSNGDCLDIPWADPFNGNQLQTYSCHYGANQTWDIWMPW